MIVDIGDIVGTLVDFEDILVQDKFGGVVEKDSF